MADTFTVGRDSMEDHPVKYFSYVLRLWGHGAQGEWRGMLEQIGGNRERYGFADLESLLDFLRLQLQEEGGIAADKTKMRQG